MAKLTKLHTTALQARAWGGKRNAAHTDSPSRGNKK